MAEFIEALRDVPFDEPCCSSPGMVDFSERGMAPSFWSEPVRMLGELWLEVRFQQGAYDLLHQFVRPYWHAERTFLPVFLRDEDAPCWKPLIPFISQSFNDSSN